MFHSELFSDQDSVSPQRKTNDSSYHHLTENSNEDGRELKTRSSSKKVSVKDFVMLKVIGQGSFGKVMLVRKRNAGNKLYAMKVLDRQRLVQHKQVEHTRTERNVMGETDHPFIVRLFYAFQTATKLYFVMDFMSGGELFYHLERQGKFNEYTSKLYAAEIICALGYLHKKGVVYRDLKPENIMLDKDGHIQITDFGLSKEGIMDNSSAHSFCGTPEYLAPEVLTRVGHGRAADWWSLGCLMYEMLSGMPPFYSRDKRKLFHKILHDPLKIPRNMNPEAASLLKGLLERDPHARMGSGETDYLELQQHAFFADIDWKALMKREIQAPFCPQNPGLKDSDIQLLEPECRISNAVAANFDSEFTTMPITHSVQQEVQLPEGFTHTPTQAFTGFTYVAEGMSPLRATPVSPLHN